MIGRIGLTGAFGYVGSATARHLRDAGHEIHTLTNRTNLQVEKITVAPLRFELDYLIAQMRGMDIFINNYWIRFPRRGANVSRGRREHQGMVSEALPGFPIARGGHYRVQPATLDDAGRIIAEIALSSGNVTVDDSTGCARNTTSVAVTSTTCIATSGSARTRRYWIRVNRTTVRRSSRARAHRTHTTTKARRARTGLLHMNSGNGWAGLRLSATVSRGRKVKALNAKATHPRRWSSASDWPGADVPQRLM